MVSSSLDAFANAVQDDISIKTIRLWFHGPVLVVQYSGVPCRNVENCTLESRSKRLNQTTSTQVCIFYILPPPPRKGVRGGEKKGGEKRTFSLCLGENIILEKRGGGYINYLDNIQPCQHLISLRESLKFVVENWMKKCCFMITTIYKPIHAE